jgi:hypothetical protein
LLAAIKRQTAEPELPPTPKDEPIPHVIQIEEKPKKRDDRALCSTEFALDFF